jgi:hypothetical protein
MGTTRLRAAWVIASYYRTEYDAVFTDWPLPMVGTIATVSANLETQAGIAGQCKASASASCPA